MALLGGDRKAAGATSAWRSSSRRSRRRLALLGASGCGKSVTLKCIAGIVTPGRGADRAGRRVTLYDSAAKINLPPQKRRVGYLFQQYALFPNMTVAAEHRRRRCGTGPARQADVAEKLRQLPAGGGGGPAAPAALRRAAAAVRPGPDPGLGAPGHSAGRALLRPGQLSEMAAGAGAGGDCWTASPARCSGSPTTGERCSATAAGCACWTGAAPSRCRRWRSCSAPPARRRRPGSPAARTMPAPCPRRRPSSCRSGMSPSAAAERSPPEVRRIGIRAHHVQPAGPGAENAFPCAVVRVIDDVFSTIVLLRPEGAGAGGAPAADGAGQEPPGGRCRTSPVSPSPSRRRPFCCWNHEGG